MVELIKLPYRHYGISTQMDLRYPPNYGRVIQLHPFISEQVCKYKLIENQGNRICERTLLIPKNIDPCEAWWTGERCTVYPIQCRVITPGDCILGTSFKYVNGIVHYLQDYQADGCEYITSWADKTINPLAQLVIPSPEEFIMHSGQDDMEVAETLFHNINKVLKYERCDWLKSDIDITELYHRVRYSDMFGNGIISLASTDTTLQCAIGVDNDPIRFDCATWDLINHLNEIVATDIHIVVTKNDHPTMEVAIQIDMTCRYNLSYIDDPCYISFREYLEPLVYTMILERFSNRPWVKIEIEKLWSEEVFVYVYEQWNPSVISEVLYFDLPIFSLGTFGIQSVPMFRHF